MTTVTGAVFAVTLRPLRAGGAAPRSRPRLLRRRDRRDRRRDRRDRRRDRRDWARSGASEPAVTDLTGRWVSRRGASCGPLASIFLFWQHAAETAQLVLDSGSTSDLLPLNPAPRGDPRLPHYRTCRDSHDHRDRRDRRRVCRDGPGTSGPAGPCTT